MRDFTMAKCQELCRVLLVAGYIPVTVHRYLTDPPDNRTVILRHDVDRKPKNALKMAELESALGIHATYYFRHPYTFEPSIIRQILSLGHEVGYHYEVFAKAKGDYEKAIGLFSEELKEFRSLCDVQTICMHGSPLSRYDNRDLWKEYDFRDYSIVGEAYLSMAEKNITYFTDTGRSWSGRHSVRDVMPGTRTALVESTDELIEWIRSAGDVGLYLTIHPERWALGDMEWVSRSLTDLAMNRGKKIIKVIRP